MPLVEVNLRVSVFYETFEDLNALDTWWTDVGRARLARFLERDPWVRLATAVVERVGGVAKLPKSPPEPV